MPRLHRVSHWFESDIAHCIFIDMQIIPDFYYIPTAIDLDVVNVIRKQCEQYALQDSTVLSNTSNGDLKTNIRKSKNAWIPTDNWISGMMSHFINSSNESFFKYDLREWSDKIQYTVYDEKGSLYSWHIDGALSTFNPEYVRKLSISLILSDPSEYEGGEIQIMLLGKKEMVSLKPPIGTAIIFPSTAMHRVRPLKSGKRISLVGWYGGPPFK